RVLTATASSGSINLIVVLEGRGSQRRVAELAAVRELAPGGDYVLVSSNPETIPESISS
ncbi:MAG: hypothetical protein G4V63_16125, partial [Candidatus Afipia apatlaquensis]|nr:hypothetical protein [Candidatus Afipia apatlaquensis]